MTEKKTKQSIRMQGNANAAKTGLTKGSKVNNWLRETGIMAEIDATKPEESGDFVKDVISQGKWLKERQAKIETFLEIYATVGGTAANFAQKIYKLEMQLANYEMLLESKGINPMTDKQYMDWTKIHNQMIIDANKLNIDYAKASTIMSKKDKENPEGKMW